MAINESKLRMIIRQEARRILVEGVEAGSDPDAAAGRVSTAVNGLMRAHGDTIGKYASKIAEGLRYLTNDRSEYMFKNDMETIISSGDSPAVKLDRILGMLASGKSKITGKGAEADADTWIETLGSLRMNLDGLMADMMTLFNYPPTTKSVLNPSWKPSKK